MNIIKHHESGRNWYVIPSTKETREDVRKIQRSKYSNEKVCKICGEKFDYGYSTLRSCLGCKIMVKCSICGKEFKLDLSKFSGTDQNKIMHTLLNGQDLNLFCSKKCRSKSQGINYAKFCKENPDKCKRPSTYDEATGHYFRGARDLTLQAAQMRERYQKIAENDPDFVKDHRKKCSDSLQKFLSEHPDLAREISIANITKWNESEKGKRFLKEHGRVIGKQYGGTNILSKPNFIEKDGVICYLDRETGNYAPWEECKKAFINESSNKNISFPNFIIVPTFRPQHSESWHGIRGAFEHHLVDLGIKWFVYIKFYIDSIGNIKPLVVGKSGSLSVNVSGSDLSFSTAVEDGPSRRFLHDCNLEWWKENIAIRNFDDECDALEYEQHIAKKYKLFQS